MLCAQGTRRPAAKGRRSILQQASHLSELAAKEVSVSAVLSRLDSRASDDGNDAAGIDDSNRNERDTTFRVSWSWPL